MNFFIAINIFLEKIQNLTKRITPQFSPMIILYVVNFFGHKIKTPCIYIYIYIYVNLTTKFSSLSKYLYYYAFHRPRNHAFR